MGGKSSRVSTAPVDAMSQQAAQIAQQLFSETTPLRTGITGQFEDLLGIQPQAQPTFLGGAPGFSFMGSTINIPGLPTQPAPGAITTPSAGPTGLETLSDVAGTLNPFIENAGSLTIDPNVPDLFGGRKAALENQFNIAQDRLLELLPQGGSLNQGLIDLEGDRAFGLSQVLAEIAAEQALARERGLDRAIGVGGAQLDVNQRNIDRALNLASGGTANALQGFGVGGNLAAQSAGIQAGMANARAAQAGDTKSGLGQAAGKIISAGKLS